MRLGAIILKLRLAKTSLGNYIGGAAELSLATKGTLQTDMAFVIPMDDTSSKNELDNSVDQSLVERFGIVVALKNDRKQSDKFGIIAYEKLHNIRNEFFKALLGWEIPDGESIVTYAGGKLLDIDAAYLWYQYEFQYVSRIIDGELIIKDTEKQTTEIYEAAEEVAKEESGEKSSGKYLDKTAQEIQDSISQPDVSVDFKTIYMNLIQWPSADLPYTGELPVSDNFPDVALPDMANWIDMAKHPYDGAFDRGFADGFSYYKILNRRE